MPIQLVPIQTGDGTITLPGVVKDPRFGQWQRQVSYYTQFGLIGATSLNGGMTFRDLVFPMLIFNEWFSITEREQFKEYVDAAVGSVYTFNEFDPSGMNIMRTYTNCELIGLVPHVERLDPILGWWIDGEVTLRQLQPVFSGD